MGLDWLNHRCRWIRNRLPLLAGGDLTGADRRKVERHLLACQDCRGHESSLQGALGALHLAAVHSPVELSTDSPSLWLSLDRQIREAKHQPQPLTSISAWAETLSRPWLAAAAVLVFAGLAAVGVDSWVHSRIAASQAEMIAAARPVEVPLALLPLNKPTLPLLPQGTRVAQAETPVSAAAAPSPTPSPARPAGARVDYDLDHGTPMGPGGRDVKASY